MVNYIRSFLEIGLADVNLVGGKTASLGELYSVLASEGIAVPSGFAITADAYREASSRDNVAGELHQLLDGIDKGNIRQLASKAAKARAIIYEAVDTLLLRNQVEAAYRQLEREAGTGVAVAVRSSATAEDLPTASFASQHESYLNVRGPKDLFEACRRCFASIFTDRAISYRIDNGFDHFEGALSVAVMKMVRSDLAASGVVFALDTESGFRDVVFVTGCYGLGETIVQGQVDPDEFYVHKPTLSQGYRRLGAKQIRMIDGQRGGDHATLTRKVPEAERRKYCISDGEVLSLAEMAVRIEAHYSKHAGVPTPMDIEWAKDGADGQLCIIQARPETVASRRSADVYETYNLKERGSVIVHGRAVGEKIASGRARRVVSGRAKVDAHRRWENLRITKAAALRKSFEQAGVRVGHDPTLGSLLVDGAVHIHVGLAKWRNYDGKVRWSMRRRVRWRSGWIAAIRMGENSGSILDYLLLRTPPPGRSPFLVRRRHESRSQH